MKKISFLIFALIACTSSVRAQIGESTKQNSDDDFGQRSAKKEISNETPTNAKKVVHITTKHYNYELSVGPRLGFGLATMSEGDGLSVADGSGLAFDAGLAVNVRFGSKYKKNNVDQYLDGQGLFGVGLELNYKSYGIKTKKDDKFSNDNLKFGYFEIPLLLQFYPLYKTKQLKNLYVELGPTFSIPLSSSPDKLTYSNSLDQTTGLTRHTLYEETTYPTKDLKGYDVKLTFGLGYRFNKLSANDGFYINARYNLGTSKLAGNFPGKIHSAELTIGYTFKCIGTKKKAKSSSSSSTSSSSKQTNTHKRVEL